MLRKSSLLLSLLNLVLRPVSGQILAPSNPPVALPQHPPAHDRKTWCAYWKRQGQPWRTEPEIDAKRQQDLENRVTAIPGEREGREEILYFNDVQLNRADMEWLLAIHRKEDRTVFFNIGGERRARHESLNLSGADLRNVNLSSLPMRRVNLYGAHLEGANLRSADLEEALLVKAYLEGANLNFASLQGVHLLEAKLTGVPLYKAHLERASLPEAHMEGSNLQMTHLEGAQLIGTHLEGADLRLAHLEGANLGKAHLEGAKLQGCFFDSTTRLHGAMLNNKQWGSAFLADLHWGDVNVTAVDWSTVPILGDEYFAQRRKELAEYHTAVRTNRQLATILQSQGLNEDAARFAYRAQILQKSVFYFQIFQKGAKLRQRVQALGAWLFSWFLFLLAGYGYKLWRSFLTYTLVIIGFTMAYYLLGASFKPSLSLVNALGLSMTSFHGRGFFPGVTQLNDLLTILTSIEAFVGLILEATFIATLTQRFFGK